MPNIFDSFSSNVARRANRLALTVDEWDDDDEDEAPAAVAEPVTDPLIVPEAGIPAPPPRRTRKKPVQSIAPEDFVGPPLPPPEVIPLREITQTDKTSLGYTIGIELTAMPDLSEKERSSFGGTAASYLARLVREVVRHKRMGYHDIDRDQEAVEASSEVLKTWGEVKKFYDVVKGAFDRFGLLTHVADTISGGGHIHVGGMKPAHQANTLRDIQNRPYLNWIFNDPDDLTTMTYAEDLEAMSAKLKKMAPEANLEMLKAFGQLNDRGKSAILFYGDPKHVDQEWFPDDKRKMVRVKSGYGDTPTFEFRFFQAPVDWNEQQAHLEFVLRYLEYTKTKYAETPAVVTMDTREKIKAITEEQSVIEFRKLLAELSLPEAPYERMLLENLPVWFERGKRV